MLFDIPDGSSSSSFSPYYYYCCTVRPLKFPRPTVSIVRWKRVRGARRGGQYRSRGARLTVRVRIVVVHVLRSRMYNYRCKYTSLGEMCPNRAERECLLRGRVRGRRRARSVRRREKTTFKAAQCWE